MGCYQIQDKLKYAKFKALDIVRAIKEGRTPTAGPPDGVRACLLAPAVLAPAADAHHTANYRCLKSAKVMPVVSFPRHHQPRSVVLVPVAQAQGVACRPSHPSPPAHLSAPQATRRLQALAAWASQLPRPILPHRRPRHHLRLRLACRRAMARLVGTAATHKLRLPPQPQPRLQHQLLRRHLRTRVHPHQHRRLRRGTNPARGAREAAAPTTGWTVR